MKWIGYFQVFLWWPVLRHVSAGLLEEVEGKKDHHEELFMNPRRHTSPRKFSSSGEVMFLIIIIRSCDRN